MAIVYGYKTDIGQVRLVNQDSIGVCFFNYEKGEKEFEVGIFLLADGMGSPEMGKKASSLAIQVVLQQLMKGLMFSEAYQDTNILELLKQAFNEANQEVINHAPEGGTTLTTAVVIGSTAYIAHVGDSRCYLISPGSVKQLTTDHNLLEKLIELGHLSSREEAFQHPGSFFNLYQALGHDKIEAETIEVTLPLNARLLLCSGFLSHLLNTEELNLVLNTVSPQEACNKLVELANIQGGLSNSSVMVIGSQ